MSLEQAMTPLEEVQALLEAALTSSQRRTVISRAYYVTYRLLIGVSRPEGFDPDARDAQRPASVHARLFNFLEGAGTPILRKIGREQIRRLYRLRIMADYRFASPVTFGDAKAAMTIAQDIEDWIGDAGLKSAF